MMFWEDVEITQDLTREIDQDWEEIERIILKAKALAKEWDACIRELDNSIRTLEQGGTL